MKTESKLKAIIGETFSVDQSLIRPDSGFAKGNISNWDSLGHLVLILKIEEVFKIKCSMLEIQEMNDFSAILALVNQKLS